MEHKELVLKGILNILQRKGLGEMCTLSSTYHENTTNIIVHRAGDKTKVEKGIGVPFQPITIENLEEQTIRLCHLFSFPLADPTSIEKLIKAVKICIKNQQCSKCLKDVEENVNYSM